MKNLILKIRFLYLVYIKNYFNKPGEYYYPYGYAPMFLHNFPFSFDWRKFWLPAEAWGNIKDGDNPYIVWLENQRALTGKGIQLITDLNESVTGPGIKSGQLCSWNSFYGKYGRYRAMIKVPPKGAMYWFSFWLTINGNAEEIDIFEMMDEDSRGFTVTLHAMVNGKKQIVFCRHFMFNVDLSHAFHFYEMEWQKGFVSWYLDGIKLCEYTGKHVPQVDMGIIINNAVARGFKPDGVPAEKLNKLFPAAGYVSLIEVLRKL